MGSTKIAGRLVFLASASSKRTSRLVAITKPVTGEERKQHQKRHRASGDAAKKLRND
jgi:hypothetical protein